MTKVKCQRDMHHNARVKSAKTSCTRGPPPCLPRRTIKDKAVSQQYLTPQEEKAVVDYALRMSSKGWPVPVKLLRSIALVIRRHRDSVFHISSDDDGLQPPGKNWPQGFYKRHPELKAVKVKALDWKRHDHSIFDKVTEWFSVIGKELRQPGVLAENVYNIDETGVLLSVLNSLKVLVGRDETSKYRGAGVQRKLITAIECISADGRALDPLIIWPASTHRSTWTAHPTPGWHFACSKTGYTDTEISLYWMQHVFDPLTKMRARGKPRVLISDGFSTHESLEFLTYCFQNNIILCRLPSHTSHKLQPCDVGVFGPLKSAYREQVERLYRGGASVVRKEHFSLLYSRAREGALTRRNILSSWAKAGLYPFIPTRVLGSMQQPAPSGDHCSDGVALMIPSPSLSLSCARTPTSFAGFNDLRCKVENELGVFDNKAKLGLEKLWHAAERAYTDRTMLVDENKILFEQNNEKTVRATGKTTVVGRAKVMSYQDILDAQQKRSEKENKKAAKQRMTLEALTVPVAMMLSDAEAEKIGAVQEIDAMGLRQFCRVLDFGMCRR